MAEAALLPGFPFVRFYTTNDPAERWMLDKVRLRATEMAAEQRKDLARRIVNTYYKVRSKALKSRGKGK